MSTFGLTRIELSGLVSKVSISHVLALRLVINCASEGILGGFTHLVPSVRILIELRSKSCLFFFSRIICVAS